MKIGVISDTHIADKIEDVPVEILEAFKHVDMVLHAGDLVNANVLEQLKKSCKNVVAVWGNMDPGEVKGRLHEKEIISVNNFKIGLIHGFGPPATLMEFLNKAFAGERLDIIVFGHSHNPMNEKKNGILYFNPGSPTDKVFAPYNSYGIIEVDQDIKATIVKL